MKLTGDTIFVTGGGSGIGRGLAETLHRLGNQVIISGRRQGQRALLDRGACQCRPALHAEARRADPTASTSDGEFA